MIARRDSIAFEIRSACTTKIRGDKATMAMTPFIVACVAFVAARIVAAEPRTATTTTTCVWQPCAVVVTDHADALEAWVDASTAATIDVDVGLRGGRDTAAAALTVLHIDYHADLNVPSTWIPRGQLRAGVRAADLASFQLAAVWAGLVDRVSPPDEDVFHDVVEAALFAVKNFQGILREDLQAKGVSFLWGNFIIFT